MPYPNEHACRLRDPGEFQAGSFRSTEREHEGKAYRVISGKLKNDQAMTEQAYRYNREVWTASSAHSHCQEHGGRFEEASGKERKAGEFPHIVEAIGSTVWAIVPEKLKAIIEVLSSRLAGVVLSDAELAERYDSRRATGFTAVRGQIGVMGLYGVISQRQNLFSRTSGGTSTDMFAAGFKQLVNERSIGAIVLDVDSPGGSVYGVHELSRVIYESRGQKPIIAVANSLMASGAYWIASAADEIVVTPGGEVGSVGVVATHVDTSSEQERLGRKVTLVYAGRHKTEGNPFEPLSDEALNEYQTRVDEYYELFVADLARNRGVTAREVKSNFGEGRVLGARQAREKRMVDRIGTLDQVIRDLTPAGKPSNLNRAAIAIARVR